MLLTINPDNPSERKINQVVQILQRGGVIIYPTDTVYGFGCDITNPKAIEKVYRLRGLNPKKSNLSFICKNIAQLAEYTLQIDNQIFKMLKRNLPGPFTFIFKANSKAPKLLKTNRKTVGIRIPDNNIALAIIEALGNPILTTSLKSGDEILEYFTNPSEIHDDFEKLVDLVIDGGIGNNVASTVIDCTTDELEIIREGVGELIY